ncbi:hypothetical protein L7D48_24675, partial [Streptomyces sp. S1A]|nr:hypothetical protein [Streptomyces sp. ICN903]
MSTENEGAAGEHAAGAPVPHPPADRSAANDAAAPRTPTDSPPEDYDLQAPTPAPAPEAAPKDESTTLLRKIEPEGPEPSSRPAAPPAAQPAPPAAQGQAEQGHAAQGQAAQVQTQG